MSNRTILQSSMHKDELIEEVFGELGRATADTRHPYRFVVLGTVDSEGGPRQRWVVFRDYNQESYEFLIYTDARSSKVAEIQAKPEATLLFYHDKKKLQLRVRGHASIIEDPEILNKHWEQSAKHGASSYTSKLAPGSPIDEPEEGWEWDKEDYSNFRIIQLSMREMEFLQLDGERHIRGTLSPDAKGSLRLQYLTP